MKGFFNKLLNSEDPTSSKRFTALVGLILLVGSIVCSLAGIKVDHEIFYVTAGLTLTALGLTALSR